MTRENETVKGNCGEGSQLSRRGEGKHQLKGFTLIEVSIVLVIIGLIVGGVLVGQDLIRAAYVRAQISQIEKFNTAVNTFYGKYQVLPGDMNANTAITYGFAPRGTDCSGSACPGEGNGDGIIEGITGLGPGNNLGTSQFGETTMFWVDLSQVQLIEGGFNTASAAQPPYSVSGSSLNHYLPSAKIGGGSVVYVISYSPSAIDFWNMSGASPTFSGIPYGAYNYYALSSLSDLSVIFNTNAYPSLTVAQAYSIDTKIDDGMPALGRVIASYPSESAIGFSCHGSCNAILASGISCFDNAGGGAQVQYSMSYHNGAGLNCGLMFQMQGGD